MRIGFIQFAPVFGDKQKNFAEVSGLVRGIKADLLVLPELFATGYVFTSMDEVIDLSEGPGEETSEYVRKMAAATGAAIVAGFVERDYGKYYNSAMLADRGGVIASYRKLHLFSREKLWFSPGDKPLKVYEIKGVKIGMMVCFDWIFPETCRTLALQGAQVIAHPANLVLPWAQQAMTTRCIENHVFAVTANRTGNEIRGPESLTFTGMSQVIGCKGEVLAAASSMESCCMIIEADPLKALDKKITPDNDLFRDRRTDHYRL